MTLAVPRPRRTPPMRSSASSSRGSSEWESYDDSHNGAVGPAAMVLALEAYGAPGYEIRGYDSRLGAVRDAAKAIQATKSPVILLAWRGAHTWVMTGFRADADPSIFQFARSRAPTSSTRGTRGTRASGASPTRRARSRTTRRWTATSCRGSDPRVATRIATACTSSSSRRSRRRSRLTARSGGPARARKIASSDVLRDHPGRVAERDREDPDAGDRGAWLATIDDAETGERRDDLAERVVGRVQPARQRVGEGVERDRQREGGDDQRRSVATSSAVNSPPPSRTSTSVPGQDVQRDGGERRQDADRHEVPDEDAPGTPSVVVGVGGREDREDGQRERDADEADRQDLVVEAEVERRDGSRPRDPRRRA